MKLRIPALLVIMIMFTLCPQAYGQETIGQASWNFTGMVAEGGTWAMRVTTAQRSYNPGDGLTLAIDFTINSTGLAYNAQRIEGIYTLITGIRAFNGNGDMTGNAHAMGSTILTGVGLPIEGETHGLPTDRFGGPFHHPIDSYNVIRTSNLRVDTRAGTIHGTSVHGILLSQDVPPGWYLLRIDIGLQIAEGDVVTLWGVDPALPSTTEDKQSYAMIGPLAIGTSSQPRMVWTLFSSSQPNGGVVAVEDKGYIALTRGLGYSDQVVLPMLDSGGMQIKYLLEPDFPLVWNPFIRSNSQGIDLDYHSGWMEIRIENPDRSIVDLGGAPFNGKRGMGATTLNDKFAYSFSTYGLHRIQMIGWIQDSSNQIYVGGGVYDVYVAQPLDIQTNVLNGTPFKRNYHYDPGFQIYPPFPASVDVTWQLAPYSRETADTNTFTANANRWGYYAPPILAGRDRLARTSLVQFTSEGEYKVTYKAVYKEPDGTLWMGEKIITGVVLPPDAIKLASRPPSSGSFSITSDARYVPVPADSGDTILLPPSGTPGIATAYTFPMGFLINNQTAFRTDDTALGTLDSGSAGLFVTPRLATSTSLFPHTYPGDIDRRAYLINAAARSDGYMQVRVEEGSGSAYLPYSSFPWNPGELAVDGPGDIYHFWSSMVYRDITGNWTKYGYYSSGLVVAGNITTPRLQNPGDTLISDGWGTHPLVMHNTAVCPGSIVSEGDYFTPGAYYLPLPDNSTVEFTLTPPEGNRRTITVNGDNRGYAVNMTDRIVLDKQGVWKVESKLIQGDLTGGILGVNPGEPWEFYVISNSNSMPVDFHLLQRVPIRNENEVIALTGDLTGGDIAEGSVYISATFNGAVIEQTSRDVLDGIFSYTLDLAQVANSFGNYSLFDSRDRIVISFCVIGLSSVGQYRMAAKMICIQGGMMFTGEKNYARIDPLTRSQALRDMASRAESELAHENRGRVPVEGESGESRETGENQ